MSEFLKKVTRFELSCPCNTFIINSYCITFKSSVVALSCLLCVANKSVTVYCQHLIKLFEIKITDSCGLCLSFVSSQISGLSMTLSLDGCVFSVKSKSKTGFAEAHTLG